MRLVPWRRRFGQPGGARPAIAGLDQWYVVAQLRKIQAGYRGSHPGDVAGLRMKPMSEQLRSDEALQFVASYVASLPPVDPAVTFTDADPAQGKIAYTVCTACHGADGRGDVLQNAPSLIHLSDWYIVEQLKKFKAGVRGTNEMDVTGSTMRPMAMTLADEQAMKNVAAYIATLRETKQ
ncbi:MAG: c-type cytochrome [Polyangiales bacterium]